MSQTAPASHWDAIHRIWSFMGAPLRPPATAVARIVAASGEAARGRTLVLGVTPEFHAAFDEVIALDSNPGMIAAVWPGDTETRRAVLGDWCSAIPALGGFDLCLGDLSLSQLDGPRAGQVLAAMARSLRPGGRIVLRSILRPEAPVTSEAIHAHAGAPGFNWHVLRLLIALHLSQTIGPEFPVREIHAAFGRIFPDRAAFLARTGLEAERMVLVDHYATSSLAWFVPSAAEMLALAADAGLSARIEPSGDYPAAEHLPLLVLEA